MVCYTCDKSENVQRLKYRIPLCKECCSKYDISWMSATAITPAYGHGPIYNLDFDFGDLQLTDMDTMT